MVVLRGEAVSNERGAPVSVRARSAERERPPRILPRERAVQEVHPHEGERVVDVKVLVVQIVVLGVVDARDRESHARVVQHS